MKFLTVPSIIAVLLLALATRGAPAAPRDAELDSDSLNVTVDFMLSSLPPIRGECPKNACCPPPKILRELADRGFYSEGSVCQYFENPNCEGPESSPAKAQGYTCKEKEGGV
ncbi:hypothetical protein C8R43DRAFT_1000733 [Mycena crocata]|nr:hypothetical protein C8R43DRAFT_1000733 [Mycena crocata]